MAPANRAVDTALVTLATILTALANNNPEILATATLAMILMVLANNVAHTVPATLVTTLTVPVPLGMILTALGNKPVAPALANKPADMAPATPAMTRTALGNKVATMVPEHRAVDMDRAAPAMILNLEADPDLVSRAITSIKIKLAVDTVPAALVTTLTVLANNLANMVRAPLATILMILDNKPVVMAVPALPTTLMDLELKVKDSGVVELGREILRVVPLMTILAVDCNKAVSKDMAVNRVVAMMITIE